MIDNTLQKLLKFKLTECNGYGYWSDLYWDGYAPVDHNLKKLGLSKDDIYNLDLSEKNIKTVLGPIIDTILAKTKLDMLAVIPGCFREDLNTEIQNLRQQDRRKAESLALKERAQFEKKNRSRLLRSIKSKLKKANLTEEEQFLLNL